jgi:hypothetical protein
MDESQVRELLDDIPSFGIEQLWITNDSRPERISARWINVLLRKTL